MKYLLIYIVLICCPVNLKINFPPQQVNNSTTDHNIEKKNFFKISSFADSVVLYDPGALGKNTGGEPDTIYQNPATALGCPEINSDNDSGYVSLGLTGTLIIKFTDNVLIDGPGPDIKIFEINSDEKIKVWISSDGIIYKPIVELPGEKFIFEINSYPLKHTSYSYLKIRDASDKFTQNDSLEAVGADIDAICALNSELIFVYNSDHLFNDDNKTLSIEGKKKLFELSEKISKLSRPKLFINAYLYSGGTDTYKLILTQMQADAVYKFFRDIETLQNAEYRITGLGDIKNFNNASLPVNHSTIEILIQDGE